MRKERCCIKCSHVLTISSQFFAIYIHKYLSQNWSSDSHLRCWTGVNHNWFRNYDTKRKSRRLLLDGDLWVQWPCISKWRLTEISAWYTFHHNVLTSDLPFNSKQRTEQPFYGQFGQMTSPGLIAFYVQVLLSLKRYHSIHYWIAFKAYFQER